MDVSFGTIWEGVAARLPDAVAVAEPGRELRYAEFDDRAARLAAALEAAGVGPGDTVACYLFNGAAYLEAVFAAFKIGAVPVNVNYRYTGEELSFLLTDAGAAALVFSGDLAGRVTHAAEHVPTVRLLVRVGPAPDDEPGPPARDLDELLDTTAPRPNAPRPGSDRLFMYTGGTTGMPKGVVWRHADLLSCLRVPIFGALGHDRLPGSLDEAVAIAVDAHADGRAPVTLPAVPLMHGTGLFNTMGALLVGGQAVTLRPGRLDPRHVWETVAARGVGTLIVAGNAVCQPLVDELVRAEAQRAPHDLTSLRQVLSSGTVLGDRLKRALHERADLMVTDALASSESGPVAFAITHSVADLPSTFRPAPGTALLTEDDRILGPGTAGTGLLAFSGPTPLGYHGDAERTASTFRTVDGVRYAVPGDLAELTPDGEIRFLGRGSGVINTGGEKVHPHEIETALLAHPDVTDCVVVGISDDRWGERVAAVVATPDPDVLDGPVLQEWARRSLAGYKVPRSIVLLEALPRTPTGKLELAWAKRTVAEHEATDGHRR